MPGFGFRLSSVVLAPAVQWLRATIVNPGYSQLRYMAGLNEIGKLRFSFFG